MTSFSACQHRLLRIEHQLMHSSRTLQPKGCFLAIGKDASQQNRLLSDSHHAVNRNRGHKISGRVLLLQNGAG